MKYAKLTDGYPSYAPNPMHVGDNVVYNPPGDMYLAAGYKPVVYADDPGEAPAGYHWEETWAEEDGNIQQGWVLVEVPITEEEALVRYANELTGAEDETLTEATERLIKMNMEV